MEVAKDDVKAEDEEAAAGEKMAQKEQELEINK